MSSGSGPGQAQDPLQREQAHLDRARAELARMRRATLAQQVTAGDRVSGEYLAQSLFRRAQALTDDPGTALFFGRTDQLDGATWYIGRRHVADDRGDPVVIDWRAPISRSFYRASRTDPMGLRRRRRFGVEQGRLTAYEDEELDRRAPVQDEAGEAYSAILAREIERPRVGPMRDIVATIQPEQDEIVRSDLGLTVCVQGAPGTGKTAVGLHRAAWLLYAHRERLSRSGVLVVGPNGAFLEHVAAVLPSLGEVDVRQQTVDTLVAAAQTPVRAEHPVALARLKGDPRMAELVRRAVWAHLQPPSEGLSLSRGTRVWRVPRTEVAEIVEELAGRGVRYLAARAMLAQRLAHAVLLRLEAAGDSPDDRVQDAVARSREVRRLVDGLWPRLTPAAVLFRLLADPAFLAGCAVDLLEDAEQQLLSWSRPPRSPRSARWSSQDLVLLDEIADQLERVPSVGHVVLDEAQDLSPMQLRAVGRRCSTGSATVLGDIAQGTTPWAVGSWTVALGQLGRPGAVVEELTRGFRVPTAVIELVSPLLPLIAPGLKPPVSVRSDPGQVHRHRAAGAQGLWPAALAALREALAAEGSVALVVSDPDLAKAAGVLHSAGIEHRVLGTHPVATPAADQVVPALEGSRPAPPRVSLVAATSAKGLEFDTVVVLEPAAIAAAEPEPGLGLRRLYVVLTRAVSTLHVVHLEPLPTPLA